MTKTNKLIVAGVVVLGAYYLYSKNKAKSEVADLKEGADLPETTQEVAEVPKIATEVNQNDVRQTIHETLTRSKRCADRTNQSTHTRLRTKHRAHLRKHEVGNHQQTA